MRYFAVYECDPETGKKLAATFRAEGVELVEAGPESVYAADIRVAQRRADAVQHAAAVAEVSRLRHALVLAAGGDRAAAAEALQESARLEWAWIDGRPEA